MINYVIDTHGHYLFGVDDGASDLEMSLEMIKSAYEQGVREIFCTSHDIAPAMEYKRNLMLLRKSLENKGIDIKLHAGNEVQCGEIYMGEVIKALNNGEILPMGNSRYVLMEFSTWSDGEEVIRCVTRLRNETDFEPIIAHIERYRFLFDDPQILHAIKEMQIPVQVNAYSLVEDSDDERRVFVKKLLDEKLVTFIGSDTHGTGHRPVRLDTGIKYIYENYDEEYVNSICFQNAQRMLLV